MQGKRISSLTNQIERLRVQNENLKQRNTVLSDSVEIYKYQLESIEDIKQEYIDGLAQIHAIKKKYMQAVNEAHMIKKEYELKFKQLLGTFS